LTDQYPKALIGDTVTGQCEEMVLVPGKPTQAMIDAAFDYAISEDAEAVWLAMVKEFETSKVEGGTLI
jgi:hypothetical protein